MKRLWAFSAAVCGCYAAEESIPVCRIGDDFDDGTPCVGEGDILLQTKAKKQKHVPGEEGDPPPEADVDEVRSC